MTEEKIKEDVFKELLLIVSLLWMVGFPIANYLQGWFGAWLMLSSTTLFVMIENIF